MTERRRDDVEFWVKILVAAVSIGTIIYTAGQVTQKLTDLWAKVDKIETKVDALSAQRTMTEITRK